MKNAKYIHAFTLGILVIVSNISAAFLNNSSYQFGKSAVITEFSGYTITLLILSGLIMGYLSDLSLLFIFFTTITTMGTLAFAELAINKYLHSLLPFEAITGWPYVAVYVVIGAYVSRFLQKINGKKTKRI